MLRTTLLAVCALLLACKAPESGETMTLGTGESTTATSVTTVNPTGDATTDPTGGTGGTGTTEPGATTTGMTGTATGTTGETTAVSASSSGSSGGGGACTPLDCGGAIYACGDCMDNDGDGKVDLADPECVSPCDDLEDTFATGLPGDNMDPCKQDCFFDGNSGGGKGDCAWDLKCDPMSPGGDKCPYDENFNNCPDMQTQECVETCQVPNGCDCFGCCTIAVDGMVYDVYLGDADCSVDNIESCSQCTKNADCDDDCNPEMCEVCFGETEPPPGCEEAMCDGGQSCTIDDMGNSDCPEGYYCATGCCYMIQPG